MLKRLVLYSFIVSFLLIPLRASACDSCAIPLARSGSNANELNRLFFFDFTVEQQRWEEQDAMALHELHHEGHHVHYKTHEEYYHFSFGSNPSDRWTLLADLPYVVRHSKQVDQHSRVGAKEVSEGLGDLKMTATYRFLKDADSFLGIIGGVKFPTGETKELNPVGVLFEQELQPGSGSYDYILGSAFQMPLGNFQAHGNILYTIKTEGTHDFEFGNVFSSYIILDAPVVSRNEQEIRLGADINLHIEDKQTDAGEEIADSGGTTLLIGPSLTMNVGPMASLYTNILFPVHQNIRGVHQELNCIWNAGAKITW
jgi:hypothetical protein